MGRTSAFGSGGAARWVETKEETKDLPRRGKVFPIGIGTTPGVHGPETQETSGFSAVFHDPLLLRHAACDSGFAEHHGDTWITDMRS